jgi:hypothetical protein
MYVYESIQYIEGNNPTSAYATHILHYRLEYGIAKTTLQLLKHCQKGTGMDIWESMYIHAYNKHNKLIPEEHDPDHNPIYDLAQIPRDMNTHS